ncbi:hypothetical protein RUM44_001164 [Polyplax serrata]|uniref:Uncharacterized protein n=1 Tax=Polyplax serrata TaxID=468196 RepID=A0ABR1BAH2_POLSC
MIRSVLSASCMSQYFYFEPITFGPLIGIENKNEVYSCTQLNGKRAAINAIEHKFDQKQIKREVKPVPKFVTAKIFASSVKKEVLPATRPTVVTSKIFSGLPKPGRQNEIRSIVQPLPVSVTPTNSFFPVSPNTLSPVPEASKPVTRTLRPQLATSTIFAPRTEDMNKGFLMFSDDEPGLTMLKDEPEDLTHLAPTAGDACVPLDLPQLSDMFDDFLNDNYCPLLNTDELNSLSDSQSSWNSRASGDPFFSYRDDSDSAGSPSDLNGRMKSPCFTKSPGGCSIPSLCSPEQSPEDDHMRNFMSLNLDSGSSDMDDDLCLKAPFIPVDEDLPLLITATDLMWNSQDDKLNIVGQKDFTDTWPPPNNSKNESSLAQLLLSDPGPQTFDRISQNGLKICEQGREIVHLSEALNLPQSKINDIDLVPTNHHHHNRNHHHKSLMLVSDRATKRAHSDLTEKTVTSKRKKNDRVPSQLLQNLMSMPRPRGKGREESVWLADGGGGSASESPPPQKTQQSHSSVLMNLLEKIPKENLPTVASILRQLSVASNSRSRRSAAGEKEAEREWQKLQSNPSFLLSPEGSSIPSLIDLNQQDYDVNAPVGLDNSLLQGQDLLNALEIDGMIMSP